MINGGNRNGGKHGHVVGDKGVSGNESPSKGGGGINCRIEPRAAGPSESRERANSSR
jgi:hypothetical protein